MAFAPTARTPARISLAHDWLVGMRGGEWVLDRLARLFGPTDLYTLVNDGRHLTDAIAACEIITSPLQQMPGGAGRLRRHYLPLMPWAVERLRVKPCDLLISTSSAVMKSIIPPESVPHICYCHSPARYIWEQTTDYGGGAGGWLRAAGLKLYGKRFQHWDRRTASRVTRFIANSAHTAARIRRCFDRDAEVVHPPVRTDFFTIDENTPREDWFLVVGAMEPYKRTELVIDAANRAGFQLKLAGGGSQEQSLRARAQSNIEFLGRVDDQSLRDLYRRARALIFPQLEDFGIIAAEAMACGCPVIAFAGGGALETVTQQTGAFFDKPDSTSLLQAITACKRRNFDAPSIRANAMRFSERKFDEAILRIVNDVLHQIRAGGNSDEFPRGAQFPISRQ